MQELHIRHTSFEKPYQCPSLSLRRFVSKRSCWYFNLRNSLTVLQFMRAFKPGKSVSIINFKENYVDFLFFLVKA